ncbi:disease resistance protein RGA2 isoform X2 [Hevea brasiliensis]|uniref:disease resistance protein RGA2 isoform X2 n=1 Tax=Hevea brasiliensis TaxID=3981 RepID=UPI0025F3ADB3|nr:disease resistance protein RGA2 isoform X2 [Hevea brasiliensis]
MSIESYVAKKVLEKIAYAYQETCFVCGLQWELKKINDISFTMKAVLLDAEEKQVNHRQLRLWLADLKDAFYDAEDVLDEFECEAQRRRALQLYGGIIRKVHGSL